MTNIITIDVPDIWTPEVDLTAFDPDEVYYETIVTVQNEIVTVAYPLDWLPVCGGGNDGE